jgi:hypothetical protein
MSGYLLTVDATALCPHGGQVSINSSNKKVLVNNQAVATLNDTFTVAGCAFTIPPSKPQPCTKVKWLVAASRVKVGGQPVLLKDSTGLCQSSDQIPQGPPNVLVTQLKVKGT